MEPDATFEMDTPLCPVYNITRDDLQHKTFLGFVQDVFRKHPDLAMFKIKPPQGWKPTQRRPNLDKLQIETPIQQLAFGKTGSYRCLLVEQKGLSVSEFRALAESEERLPPKKCRKDFRMLERTFWKSVTMNPPLYGADTPMSLFSDSCPRWALSDISDLLTEKGVPDIPGVTTPMTYFGMWKSFFAWHVEDADLYSVNFLHWGAPKIWYAVSPAHKGRFEQLAATLHPDQFHRCKGFLRHKDILISPTLLKQYGVSFQMCKQDEGEYAVLNAAAYHAGFNCGFNTAEAVNFATEDWITTGRRAIPCTCTALKDQVSIDMRYFRDGDAVSAFSSSGSDDGDPGDGGNADSLHSSDLSDRDVVLPATGRRSRNDADRTPPVTPSKQSARQRAKTPPAPAADGPPPAKRVRMSSTSRNAAKPLRAAAAKLNAARKQHTRNEAIMAQLAALPKPTAIVYTGEGGLGGATAKAASAATVFDLVLPLDTPASNKKRVKLQCLREGRDGLYRPTTEVFEELRSSLVPIRTQLLDPGTRKPGFKLLTLRSRILSTELLG